MSLLLNSYKTSLLQSQVLSRTSSINTSSNISNLLVYHHHSININTSFIQKSSYSTTFLKRTQKLNTSTHLNHTRNNLHSIVHHHHQRHLLGGGSFSIKFTSFYSFFTSSYSTQQQQEKQVIIKDTLNITEAASKKLKEINQRENVNHYLRIQVDSGGCHGYQYKIELTTTPPEQETLATQTTLGQEEDEGGLPKDIIIEKSGVYFLVDEMSMDFLKGSTLDFVQELIGSSFQIVDNPNADSSCGCKTSFHFKG